MKKMIFSLIIVLFLSAGAYPGEMEHYLCGHLWGMHYGKSDMEIPPFTIYPYQHYRNFSFSVDGTLKSEKGAIIGRWNIASRGVTLFFQWAHDGFHCSIQFIYNSTIMGGYGEKYIDGEIKTRIIRLYKIQT